jgi:hypothetical protein
MYDEDSSLMPSMLTLSDVFCAGHHAAACACHPWHLGYGHR